MIAEHHVLDFSLKRQRILREYALGLLNKFDICDADYYLLSAAAYYGEICDNVCPICKTNDLRKVHWVMGKHLKAISGSARTCLEIAKLAVTCVKFQVYAVEVCSNCKWNYMLYSYQTGTDVDRVTT